LAVVITYKKVNVVGKYRQRLIRVDYGAADTTLTIPTGFNNVVAYSCSPTSVTAKPLDYGVVANGTITLTANAPVAACYVFVTAIGY
jgi:hypothetical protein